MIYRTKERGVAIEFSVPQRANGVVIILCDGFPTVPYKKDIMQYFSQKGFTMFYPRYHGSWESDGVFLKQKPTEAIDIVIDIILRRSIVDSYNKKAVDLSDLKKIVIFGGSFGGSVALQYLGHPNISKVISVSPVIKFSGMRGQDESVQNLENSQRFVGECYGQAYRIDNAGWEDLMSDKLLNPFNIDISKIIPTSLLLIASQRDGSIPFLPIKNFRDQIAPDAQFISVNFRGHLSLGNLGENLLRFVSYWILNDGAVYSKTFLTDLLRRKIANVIGDNLHSIIIYGSVQREDDLDAVSDIDCVITLHRPVKNEVQLLKEIFSDFPYRVQCKVFTEQEIKNINKNPQELYVHTTGPIIIPVLSSALTIEGSNPFTKCSVGIVELRRSVLQKIEQYLSRMNEIYIEENFSYDIIERWKKKTLFIIYDTGIILFGLDPSGLNKKIDAKELLSKFSPDFRERHGRLFDKTEDEALNRLNGQRSIEYCINCLHDCFELLSQ